MPIYEFECSVCSHDWTNLKRLGEYEDPCPNCGNDGRKVIRTAPKLDWAGMAMGPNAGPEFVDRFDRSHRKRLEQEKRHAAEHGDDMRGAGG